MTRHICILPKANIRENTKIPRANTKKQYKQAYSKTI